MGNTVGEMLDDPEVFTAWISQAATSIGVLNAITNCGVLDHLDDQPVAPEVLSEKCGVPADKLARLFNYMASEGIVSVLADGRIAATARTKELSRHATIVKIHSLVMETGLQFLSAFENDRSAFEQRFGKPIFDYLPENPDLSRSFVDYMRIFNAPVLEFVFTRHTFKPFDVAVDVGGSHGEMLLRLLADHPRSRGILFDLAETAEQVGPAVRSAEHGDRVEIVAGDFFKEVPAGGDLYLLKQILHDWNDAECTAILKVVRAAMEPGARLAIVDFVLPEVPQPHVGYRLDISMMNWASGRERKLSEFETMFAASGFKYDRLTENPIGQSLLEAVAV